MHTKLLLENLKRINHLEDPGVGEDIRMVLREIGEREGIRCIWVRTGTRGGLL
jgi:hypothetical protein